MAETPKRAGPTTVGTTSTTVYTAPSGGSTWALVRSVVIANIYASIDPVVVSVGVGTSNADTTAKRILSSAVIQPGESIEALGESKFLVLAGGGTPDLVYVICDTAAGVTVTASVVEGP